MKVLFLTNIPSPYRVDFFNELGKYCDLTVLYERRKATNREWQSDKNCNYNAVFLKGINVGDDKALCFSVLTYLDEKRYSRIIVGGYSTPTGILAIQYMKFKRIKYILNCDGGFVKNDSKLKFFIKKHFISGASSYLSSGNETNKYLIHYGAKKDNIYIYPFTSLYAKDILEKPLLSSEKQKIKEELNIKSDKIIIFVGQLIYRKGVDLLIDVAKELPEDTSIFIIGGKCTEEYQSLIDTYKLNNVHFFEFMSKDILFKYYKISNLFVFPTREDIWGLVINEAMANGLPIITTKNCLAGCELYNNNGLIVNVNNSLELIESVKKLINDNELLFEYSSNSLKGIKRYTIENMCQAVYEILLN